MDTLMKMPGKGLARTAVKAAGSTLINDTLAHHAEPLRIADECRRQLQQGVDTYLGGERGELEAKFLDRAKVIHSRLLRDVAMVDAAHSQLLSVLIPPFRFPLTHVQATAMLGVLFGTLSKKRADDENSAMLLASCADLFNPVSDAVGIATGLWKPAPKHPLALAIAIKQLIATSVFSPSPSELREAMKLAQGKVDVLASYAGQWLQLLERADAIVFEFDRPTWDAAYANVDSKVPLALHGQLSPRWRALNELWEAKHAAEEMVTNARLAACKTKRVKRTKQPGGKS
jgi:hypothetical protein